MNSFPEYLRVAELMRADIAANYRAGDRYPSRNELVRRHRVSYCTIQRALEELTREKLLRSERGRGTFVAIPPARSQFSAEDIVIGVLMCGHRPDVEFSPFMADVGKYLIKTANTAGASVQFFSPRLLEPSKLKRFQASPPAAGLICFNPLSVEKSSLAAIGRVIPVVYSEAFDPAAPGQKPHTWCEIDTVRGVRIGVETLLHHGRSRIGILLGNAIRHPVYAARLNAYRETLEAAGVPFDPNLVGEATEFSSASGATATEQLIRHGLDALMITTASFGLSGINTLREHNLRIPEDVSVVGCDDQLYYAGAFQCLTTVEFPIGEFARKLVEMLLGILTGNGTAEPITFAPSLQAGKSISQKGV